MEERIVLSAVIWDGGGDGLNWSDPQNWGGNVLPTEVDDVTINVPGQATVYLSDIDVAIRSVQTGENLVIETSSFKLTAASQVSGSLSLVDSTLAVEGVDATFKVSGQSAITGSSLFARNQGRIELPQLSSYSAGSISDDRYLYAENGGVLDLSHITTMVGNTQGYSTFVGAFGGSSVLLPGITQLDEQSVGVYAAGAGSHIDLSGLTTWNGLESAGQRHSYLEVSADTIVDVPNLTHLNHVDAILQGPGTLPTAQITSFTQGTLVVDGRNVNFNALISLEDCILRLKAAGSVNIPNLTNIIGASFFVSDSGTVLSLPASITAYSAGTTGGTTGGDRYLYAENGGVLDLSHITTMIGNTQGYSTFMGAFGGSTVLLPGITELDEQSVGVYAAGAGSHIDLSGLTTWNGLESAGQRHSYLEVSADTIVDVPNLTQLNHVDAILQGPGTLPTAQITSFTQGTLVVDGRNVNFNALISLEDCILRLKAAGSVNIPNLTNIIGASFYVSDSGTVLSLPASITAYSAGTTGGDRYLYAENGGVLDLSHITTMIGNTQGNSTFVGAFGGSTVLLPGITQLDEQRFGVDAAGAGSHIDLSGLTTWNGLSDRRSYFSVSDEAFVEVPNLTQLQQVDLTLQGPGSAPFGLPNLTSIDGSSFVLRNDAHLALPKVQSYSAGTEFGTRSLQVENGSTLNLSGVTTLGGNSLLVSAQGAGSEIDLSNLKSWVGRTTLGHSNSGLDVDAGAKIILDALTHVDYVDLRVIEGGTLHLASLQSIHNSNLDFGAGVSAPGFKTLTVDGIAEITTAADQLVDSGVVSVQDGSVLHIQADLSIEQSGIITSDFDTVVKVYKNVLGQTRNSDQFNIQGSFVLSSGTGTAVAPQLLEVMSRDVGAAQAGFAKNFAYGTLQLAEFSYVKLVDLSDNGAGSSSEAVYANELIVPATATLDLQGLKLYVRGAQITGTILNGAVIQIDAGGSLQMNAPTPSTIDPAGQISDWTFFGRRGQTISVQLNPGSTGSVPATPQELGWGKATLLDTHGGVLATSSSTAFGQIVFLAGINLPIDGVYTVRVEAADGHSEATGNYVIAAYDTTTSAFPLALGQNRTGTLANAFSVDRWTFSAVAGQQIQLNLPGGSNANIGFDLTGPGGFSVFTNLQSNSVPITLPSSGSYTLTVHAAEDHGGAYAFQLATTTVVNLNLGEPHHGTFAGSGQTQLFKVQVPVTESLIVSLLDNAQTNASELYLRLGAPPTRATYDYRSTEVGVDGLQVAIPTAAPGDWYVMLYSPSVGVASSFSLTAVGEQLHLGDVTPRQSAAGSLTSLRLSGAGFDSFTTVQIVSPDGSTVYNAATVSLDTFTQLTATFDLSAVPQGNYGVRVTRPGGLQDELTSAFTVTATSPARLETHLMLPDAMGYHIADTIYIQYANTGGEAMPAPLLFFGSTDDYNKPLLTLDASRIVSGFWTSAIPEGYSHSVAFLASGSVPGLLQPGEAVIVPVYYAGMAEPYSFRGEFHFGLESIETSNTTTIDWASLRDSLKPGHMTTASWNKLYPGLTANIGDTWGDYAAAISSTAQYLGRLGQTTTDLGDLWRFKVLQADGLTVVDDLAAETDIALQTPGLALSYTRSYGALLDDHNLPGALGLGWSDNWHSSLSKRADGTVVIATPSNYRRIFQPDIRRATYFNEAGDFAVLRTEGGGGYLLQEKDGTVQRFAADGSLTYIQDTNGNRITATYNAGRLTKLTHSAGPALAFGYNSAGLITSVTSSDGRTITYGYDGSGSHLTQVTGYDGRKTLHTYDNSAIGASSGNLTAVEYPDGSRAQLEYDSLGRLLRTSRNNATDALTYSYNEGQVTVTNLAGHAAHYSFNAFGQIVKTIDPLGHISFTEYDSNFNTISVTGPTGLSSTFEYDSRGNLTSQTNPLGQTTSFTYTTGNNRLASMTDARGIATVYQYDLHGNQVASIYADHSAETATYDALGNALTLTNQKGQTATYSYNADGLPVSRHLADGSIATYGYDTRGNLISATDNAGLTTLQYDVGDRLIKVTYPNGRFLEYSYDLTTGHRTSMHDQSGFTVKYEYDALGRLAELTDGSNGRIVAYSYNTIGQLSREDKGNGTFTTYTYDAAGNVLDLVNFAPGGTVNSRFEYSYNALGLRTEMGTVDGTWSYSYDPTGQLTHAAFSSTNAAIPNQDLTYQYDAVGNRTGTIVNGVSSTYVTNSLNQFTSVTSADGTTSYWYDLAGNMISKIDATATTQYTYDAIGRLISVVTGSESWIYEYDSLDNRVATIHNGQRTEDLIDPTGLGNVVQTFDSNEGVITRYVIGLGLVSQSTSLGMTYYDYDALGSTAALTASDGSVATRYSYGPFGEPLQREGSVATAFSFIGLLGVSMDENGLNNMRARHYDSELGRFTSLDPLRLNSGDANYYRYVFNSPTGLVDPQGLQDTTVGDAVMGILYRKTLRESGGSFNNRLRPEPPPAPRPRPRPMHSPVGPGGPYGPGGPFGPGSPFGPEGPGGPAGPGNTSGPDGAGVGEPGGNGTTNGVAATDPNAMHGPAGFGAQHFVSESALLPYLIEFENDPLATAPVQRLVVTNVLDSRLDLTTFELTRLSIGDEILVIPPGSQHYEATFHVDADNNSFDIEIEVGVNFAERKVFAILQAIDPLTSLPPNVLSGFLPPEDGTGRGIGFVGFSIRPEAGLASGTEIRNVARIVFDRNPPIDTNQIDVHDASLGTDPSKEALVTIDSAPPASRVTALPTTTSASTFSLAWSGADDSNGSGIASYDIYVSEDGGAYVLLLNDATLTTTQFIGEYGHTYAFYSVATDNVGSVESTPPSADTQTTTSEPVNLPPNVLDAVFSVAENSVTSSVVGNVAATDPDTTDTLTFSIIDGNSSGAFAIDPVTGVLTVANSAILNFESSSNYQLTLQVTDDHGATDTAIVNVTLVDINESPSIPAGQSFSLAENSVNNVFVGKVIASDPDSNDVIIYSITGGNTSGAFAINSTTGEIRVANSTFLDFEATPTFVLTVTATDSHSLTATSLISVNISDVDESTQLTLGSAAVTWINKQPPVTVLPQVRVNGSTDLSGGTLAISVNAIGKGKRLFDQFQFPALSMLGTGSGATFANSRIQLSIQLKAGVTNAAIEGFLRAIKFTTKGQGFKSLTRTLQVTLSSAAGSSSSISQTIHVQKKKVRTREGASASNSQ